MNRRNNLIWKVMVGLAALICTVVLLILAAARDRQDETPARETKGTGAEILFETEELVYDGEGMLDLMEGVSARDRDGNDLTDLVEVSLLADDRLTAKRIQYRLFDENGAEVARERKLVLSGYEGPKITAADPLELEASQLSDLIGVLKEQKALSAQDGFSRDITDQVTCKRKKVGTNTYEMRFQVRNQFQDSDEVTVTAHIEGEVKDPVITLYTDEAVLSVGSEWDPYAYLASADNGLGSAVDQVQVEDAVNIGVPGSYRVVYKLDSYDHTAETEAVLRVTVQ